MKKNKLSMKGLLLHAVGWATYVCTEYIANLFHIPEGESWTFIGNTLFSLPVLMLPTYFVVWVAIPQFLQKKRVVIFIMIIIGLGCMVFFGRLYAESLLHYFRYDVYFELPTPKIWKNVIRDYSVIALAICLYIIGDWHRKQQLNEQLIKAKAEAEMRLLTSQLHPHFLFNTLNNIYSLALKNSDLTAESLLKLTALLDYLVYWANKEQVSLTKEIQLLQNYLDLERLRYGKELHIKTEINVQNETAYVSPLILLPFVENCFKHGGKGKQGVFNVDIYLEVDSKLVFRIENTINARKRIRSESGGIGLVNIQKRLELIYPGRHLLNIENTDDFFSITFELIL